MRLVWVDEDTKIVKWKKENQPDNSSTDRCSITLVASLIGILGTISTSPTMNGKGKKRVNYYECQCLD